MASVTPRRAPRARARLGTRAGALGLALLGVALLPLGTACVGEGVPLEIEAPPLSDSARKLYARRSLVQARQLRAEGRGEAAERVARRGLGFDPENVDLLRLHAALLEEQGRGAEAQPLRARADALDPPPPPLADVAHELDTVGLVVVLEPPSPASLRTPEAARLPAHWPEGEVPAVLAQRVRARLPRARVVLLDVGAHESARSLAAARAWLEAEGARAAVSLQVLRSYCGSSLKDGRFSLSSLRVAAAVADPGAASVLESVRYTRKQPPVQGCEADGAARALDVALELAPLEAALVLAPAPGAQQAWSDDALRVLFPRIGLAVREAVDRGRRLLAVGELEQAAEAFRRAHAIDPGDRRARSFLDEAERSLVLTRQLDPDGRGASRAGLGSGELSDAQRRGIEAQLRYEEERREQLLSTLAVLYEARSAPTPGTVAAMRPTDAVDPRATGVALARSRLGSLDEEGPGIEVRTLYGPQGEVVARYYFAPDSDTPLLMEEDSDGDGRPDRWVGYRDGLIHEVWESDGIGPPSIHILYAEGGRPIQRVEMDVDGDGIYERIFVYDAGLLRMESWDTDGDGHFDRFQTFDETGSLTLREEDVDGDEEIDVRTAYRKGRIVRREILNPEVLEEHPVQ